MLDTQKRRAYLMLMIQLQFLHTDPYACAKLATVLADSGHDVTLAGPNGQALSRLQAEAQRYHESTSTKNKIRCISIVSIIDVYLSTLLPLIH